MLNILMITEELNQVNLGFVLQNTCLSLSCSLGIAVQVHEFVHLLTSYTIPHSGATEVRTMFLL